MRRFEGILENVSGGHRVKLSLSEIMDYIDKAEASCLLPDGRLSINVGRDTLCFDLPTEQIETTFPIKGGYAVGWKILSGGNHYLCKDGKIRELPPPISCG